MPDTWLGRELAARRELEWEEGGVEEIVHRRWHAGGGAEARDGAGEALELRGLALGDVALERRGPGGG